MKLARRSNIAPSLTLAMNARAKQMISQGIDVISFAAGEPDFSTPLHIKEAGKNAIDRNKTFYTPASGIIELKKAVVKKLERENNLIYSTEEVTINSGAKHSVFNVCAALVEEGDEVLIPAPYWVSYSEIVNILGGKVVTVPSDESSGFKIKIEDVKRNISEKTKLLILNSPNNPTGAVYTPEELYSLASLLENQDIMVISDEVYEKIVYDGNKHISIATFSDKMKSKTVVVNGVSKAFSMTGWRIGYAAGPREIIDAVNKLQGHTSGNPCSVSQWASVTALQEDASFMQEWVAEFKKRRDYIVKELNKIEGISCSIPQGAFYVFPNIKGILGKKFNGTIIENSVNLAEYLLEKAKIAVVPGEAFGTEGYIRFSFATSMEKVIEGMRRMKESLMG